MGQSTRTGRTELVSWPIGKLVSERLGHARAARTRLPSTCPFTNLPTYRLRQLDPGFTMIELTIVIALLMILAAMGLAQYKGSVVHAREATLKEDLFRMRDAIDQYYAD